MPIRAIVRVVALAQPAASELTIANDMAPAATATRATPVRLGIRTSAFRDSLRYLGPRISVTTPIGRFMKKIQRQPRPLTITPPTEGPKAAEKAPMAPQMATTWGNFSRG